MQTKLQLAEHQKTLLGLAVAESYHNQDQEAEGDPEARRHLLRELNQNLHQWGVSYLAQPRDLERPASLAAAVQDAPAVELALQQLPDQIRKWAAAVPKPAHQERPAWAEQGVALLGQCRLLPH